MLWGVMEGCADTDGGVDRVGLKPRGFLQEGGRMERGEADQAVADALELKCRSRREVVLDDELRELLNQECLDEVHVR